MWPKEGFRMVFVFFCAHSKKYLKKRILLLLNDVTRSKLKFDVSFTGYYHQLYFLNVAVFKIININSCIIRVCNGLMVFQALSVLLNVILKYNAAFKKGVNDGYETFIQRAIVIINFYIVVVK